MICPKCNKEMRKGYLFSSKDGAFSFADEVPGVFTNVTASYYLMLIIVSMSLIKKDSISPFLSLFR